MVESFTRRTKFKLEKAPDYAGKTPAEHRRFAQALELEFRKDPDLTEREKITHTLPSLKGALITNWLDKEKREPGTEFTWKGLMDWLMDQIKSPHLRELALYQSYHHAEQRINQSVTEFAAYLTTLESQMTPSYQEEHLIKHLYAKLRPEIRNAVTTDANFPTTRQALVDRAHNLELNLPLARTTTQRFTTDTRTSNHDRPSQQRSSWRSSHPQEVSKSTPYHHSGSERQSGAQIADECYYCHRPGHFC
ncbi:hypothetical protein GQ43DRAFT_127859 [Delitschia confertaspora ATCC 74209]|uniref:Retrotransposon gag domain-containing protein n=1 Tax=Delitschia confertaspora ATCC 74209 TaxID=1513339 RepID=A0A9P4MWP4_9PLEO|nr:hypothetical protein GQ43DRAFT_127859 [Delitschia confertaspora ATCC 74209]